LDRPRDICAGVIVKISFRFAHWVPATTIMGRAVPAAVLAACVAVAAAVAEVIGVVLGQIGSTHFNASWLERFLVYV